jgi:molecular chaperone DnaK
MAKVIGIDLGTTNSVCAVLDGGESRVVISEEGGRVTPSVVGFAKDGSRFVGDIAKRQLLINPEATIHSIKRFIGKSMDEIQDQMVQVHYKLVPNEHNMASVEVEGKLYSPQELSAMVLQKIKHAAENFLGETISEAVITVPAYFTDSQRQATKDAGTIAGLDVLRIINEPTAAALAYVHARKGSARIAVYDWGGGTFDISLLRVDSDIAEVLSTRGNNVLGGSDVDQTIVDWLAKQFQTETGVDVTNDNIVMQRLRDAAERAKVELSSTTTTAIHLPFLISNETGPKHLQATLTRPEFEAMAKHLFDETIAECKQAMTDAQLSPNDIEEVIMVGGSSRIPHIQEMVQQLFGRKLNKSFHPDEVVAIGAAVQASILGGETKAVTLLDVTNFSLGIEVEGRRMATLIPKNTTIPTEAAQLVSTVQENQDTVKIHVLQGESTDANDNVSLGQFELHNVQPGSRGEPRIQVQFAIDSSGIVRVSAEDTRTGVSDEIQISSPIGMSQSELEIMQDGLDSANTSGSTLDGLIDDINIHISSLEAKLITKGDDLDQAIVDSVHRTIEQAQNCLTSSDEGELNSMLQTLEEHAGLFSA